ncbi:acyl-CoA reductase [Psychrobacillus sp. PGGUH221]|uniref:acyl-CoA reductase n=1 Tax=Psychrobacillus sp. PGGUH221 TaxID=3020058 RepID=UPI0035C6D7C5
MKVFWPKNQSFEDALALLQGVKPLAPFDKEILTFTQALSKRLVRMRNMPEVVALGYWLRRANITEMKSAWETEITDKVVKSRGTVFHIAPSNVDTIFVYSWMLSLLAGNRNVIRVSSKEQGNDLLEAILEELDNSTFQKIANQTIICTYGHEENATEILSGLCHTRVIWGGDATIQKIRQTSLAPMANELAFPDRFSLAALSAEQVNQLSDEKLNKLLEQFYNDVFWFDQMACSSPRLVSWIGTNKEIDLAKIRFWSLFEKKVQSKQYELMAATQVLKYTTSLWLAAGNEVSNIRNEQYFSRIQLTDVPTEARERHCGGGLFFEYDVERLADLAKMIIDKDQTLAYFGFNRSDLLVFIEGIETRGIDRIVPIGQALNFDDVWDGQSFLKSFTREVVII